MLGAMGAGTFSSMREAVDSMVRVTGSFEPNPAAVERYNELFGLFRTAYRGLADSGFFAGLAAFQANHSGPLA